MRNCSAGRSRGNQLAKTRPPALLFLSYELRICKLYSAEYLALGKFATFQIIGLLGLWLQ
jgi:hypothetical protein